MGKREETRLKSFFKIASVLVGTKFQLCPQSSLHEGLDCFTLCIEGLRLQGAEIDVNTEYKGRCIFDYKNLFENDAEKAIELAIEYLESITEEVKIGREMPGDILIIKLKRKAQAIPSLAIEGGNNNLILAIIDDKIRVRSKSLFKILKVLRWVKPHHSSMQE